MGDGAASLGHHSSGYPSDRLLRFREPDLWSGSWYELLLEYPTAINNSVVVGQVNQAVWTTPSLSGVVLSQAEFGERWQGVDQRATMVDLYGCLQLDETRVVACGTTWIESDLILYIPVGMLELVYPVDYPLTLELNPWLPQLRQALATVGVALFRKVKFALGAIGEEISSFVSLEGMTADELARNEALLVPEQVFESLHVSPRTQRISDGLWWTG